MNNAKGLVERYIQSWNETDPVRRRALLENTFVEHAGYTDPMIVAHGLDAIDATISSVQKMFPGHVFAVAGEVDAHHDTLRFQWYLAEPSADEPIVVGFDVAKLDGDRIGQVYGFLDKVPTAS
jgi:hypothetical protein